MISWLRKKHFLHDYHEYIFIHQIRVRELLFGDNGYRIYEGRCKICSKPKLKRLKVI